MAPGSRLCHNFCANLPNPRDNKLAGNPLGVLTKSNGPPVPISHVPSHSPFLGPALAPLFFYTNNELFKQFMMGYLAV